MNTQRTFLEVPETLTLNRSIPQTPVVMPDDFSLPFDIDDDDDVEPDAAMLETSDSDDGTIYDPLYTITYPSRYSSEVRNEGYFDFHEFLIAVRCALGDEFADKFHQVLGLASPFDIEITADVNEPMASVIHITYPDSFIAV